MPVDRRGGRAIAGDAAAIPDGAGATSRFARRPTLGLAWNLTLREIRSQYNRTALGRVWSLLNPLATIAIFAIIFGLLFKAEPHVGTNSGLHSYALWVACGIIPWTFISGGIMKGMSSLLANAGLLTKVWFPRWVLPGSSVASSTATFLTELGVLTIIMACFGGWKVLLYIPVLLVLVVITAAFVLGLSLLLSVCLVYFRDLEHLWAVFNQVWFYGTGVVFASELVVEAQKQLDADGVNLFGMHLPLVELFNLNPAHQYLEAYRAVLYDFALPGWDVWLQIILWSIGSLAVGWLAFRRLSGRIVEEL